MKNPLGCESCRSWAAVLVSRGLAAPHKDLFCRACGASERRVFLAVKAGR
jgi:hypothetical protein